MRRRLIRSKADSLLTRAGVKQPPIPVEKLARSLGAEVRREESEDQDLSGFLLRDTRRNAAVIGVNKNHHPHRQRFTIAHEIGHLLLHNVDELHVDRRDALVVQKRDGTSSTGAVLEEREANFFAAELLLPRTLLEQDLDAIAVLDDEAVKRLASRYEVSVQAMTLRLVNLGILDQ